MKYNHVVSFSIILDSHNENPTSQELRDAFLRTISNIDEKDFSDYVEVSDSEELIDDGMGDV